MSLLTRVSLLALSLSLTVLSISHCMSQESRSQVLPPKRVVIGICHSLSFFLVISGESVCNLADVPNIKGRDVTSVGLNTEDSEQ
ncbi:hypothetical protein GDO78_013184 [Eleutherodactylus coqui]|uniref:Uncharacterized protein n=1 Tax=Eleutherodactylus coqui TaxID=57060 RepID=A0A8J6K436_ELECQ|nr:hypothetical protein GDO78_013184 [Eleutherodactylus coqui]